MKNIIVSMALLLSTLAVNAQENFNIKFDIKGINSANAYITVFGDKEKVKVDANDNRVEIDNGKFTIKGNTLTEGLVRISFGLGDERLNKYAKGDGFYPNKASSLWVVVYPGAEMSIEGSIVGYNYINIYPAEGQDNGENDILAKLNSKMLPLLSESGDIAVSKSFLDTKITDAQKRIFNEREEQIDGEVAKIREDFINDYPSSVAALWLMEDMLIRSQIEPSALEAPLKKVDKKYNSNYFYTVVRDRVEGAKKASVGANCPIVAGMDQLGKEFNIKDIKDKYVIIDFWGTWCGACLKGTPHMKEFRDKHADKLQIVGVANDKDVEKWKSYIEKYEMNWPNIMQGKGEQDYVAKFNVQGFPTKVLISPKGKILYRESGESKEFYEIIEQMINKK